MKAKDLLPGDVVIEVGHGRNSTARVVAVSDSDGDVECAYLDIPSLTTFVNDTDWPFEVVSLVPRPDKRALVDDLELPPGPLAVPTTTIRYALVDGGKAPERKTKGSAAFDLYARLPQRLQFWQGKRCRVPLGVRFEIPDGWVGRLYLRSSSGERGLIMQNAVGVIDSDYRGEVCAPLTTTSVDYPCVDPGERIAQIIFEKLPPVTLERAEGDVLSETARGEGGFGSTGVK